MTLKAYLLNDGYEIDNWGLIAASEGLEMLLNNSGINITKTLTSEEMKRKSSLDKLFLFNKKVFNENTRLSKYFSECLLPSTADEFDKIAKIWLKGDGGSIANKFIADANQVDIVIFSGEGSCYRKNIVAIKGLFMIWFAKNYLNKEAMFCNGSITLDHVDAVLPAMLRKVADSEIKIFVRENCSYDSVLKYYPDLCSKIDMLPDSVFALDSTFHQDYNDDYFTFSMSMLPMDFSEDNLIDSPIYKLLEATLLLVPNVIFLAKDREDQRLRKLANLFQARFIGPNYSYKDVENIISKSKFLITGRYHHAIFSLRSGTPIIPLKSSSHKIDGLIRFYDDFPATFDPSNLIKETPYILKTAQQILSNHEELRERTYSKSKELKDLLINEGYHL